MNITPSISGGHLESKIRLFAYGRTTLTFLRFPKLKWSEYVSIPITNKAGVFIHLRF
jgi:hypothetical protein